MSDSDKNSADAKHTDPSKILYPRAKITMCSEGRLVSLASLCTAVRLALSDEASRAEDPNTAVIV